MVIVSFLRHISPSLQTACHFVIVVRFETDKIPLGKIRYRRSLLNNITRDRMFFFSVTESPVYSQFYPTTSMLSPHAVVV